MTDVDVPQRFQGVLRPHLPYAVEDLSGNDDLAALGLDSMGVVQLLADIETSYDVELPDEILTGETFSTVGSLWSALRPLVGPDADAA